VRVRLWLYVVCSLLLPAPTVLPAADDLTKALMSGSPSQQRRALHDLDRLPADEATRALTKLAETSEATHRAIALQLLGRWHTPEALAVLRHGLPDPDIHVRSAAAWALVVLYR
jgi:HEAT repeat protein